MALSVMSPALTWRRQTPQVPPGAALLVTRHSFAMPGFDIYVGALRVGTAVAFLAIACGAMLLLEPNPNNRGLLRTVQCCASAAILVLAVLHIGPYPGVVLAILGALTLIWGALERYR